MRYRQRVLQARSPKLPEQAHTGRLGHAHKDLYRGGIQNRVGQVHRVLFEIGDTLSGKYQPAICLTRLTKQLSETRSDYYRELIDEDDMRYRPRNRADSREAVINR